MNREMLIPCQCCQREIDGMDKSQFKSASFGHENCIGLQLMSLGVFSEEDAARNCACFRVGHKDYVKPKLREFTPQLLEDMSKLLKDEAEGVNRLTEFDTKYRSFSVEMLEELKTWADKEIKRRSIESERDE